MIVIDIDMPKSCHDCPIRTIKFCDILHENIKEYRENRHEKCPIKFEVPNSDGYNKEQIQNEPTMIDINILQDKRGS